MSATRDRKQAAKILGITMQAQLRALLEAQGEEAIQMAAIQLGDTFNRNIEFVINVLKDYGGMTVRFERVKDARPAKMESGSQGRSTNLSKLAVNALQMPSTD